MAKKTSWQLKCEPFKGQHPRFASNEAAARAAWGALYIIAREGLMEMERREQEALPATALFGRPVVVSGSELVEVHSSQ